MEGPLKFPHGVRGDEVAELRVAHGDKGEDPTIESMDSSRPGARQRRTQAARRCPKPG